MKSHLSLITAAVACGVASAWSQSPPVPAPGTAEPELTRASQPTSAPDANAPSTKTFYAAQAAPQPIDPSSGQPAPEASANQFAESAGRLYGGNRLPVGGEFWDSSSVRGGDGGASLVCFTHPEATQVDETVEDLSVLSLILARGLEHGLAEGRDYKLGIPMLLSPGGHAVQASYVQGFGALFQLQVRFPVVAPAEPEQSQAASKPNSEWEEARRALLGQAPPRSDWNGESSKPSGRYDARLVEGLRRQVLEALKNASNLRHVGSEESIVVTIVGSPNGDGSETFGTGGGSAGTSATKPVPGYSRASRAKGGVAPAGLPGTGAPETSPLPKEGNFGGGGGGAVVGSSGAGGVGGGGVGAGGVGGGGIGGGGIAGGGGAGTETYGGIGSGQGRFGTARNAFGRYRGGAGSGMAGIGGGGGSFGPEPRAERPTVMTIRVKKATVDALAAKNLSGDQFKQEAVVTTYLGALSGNLSPTTLGFDYGAANYLSTRP